MRRGGRIGLRPGALSTLATGMGLAGFYLLMLALTASLGSPPRPLYDGICPNGCGPTVCPPPQSSCGPTYAPYSPPSTPSRPTPTQGGPPTIKPQPSQGGVPSQPAGSASVGPGGGASAAASGTTTSSASPSSLAPAAQVGPGGGEANSADGAARLVIPAGALAGPTTFALTPLKAGPPIPAGMAATGPVFDLSASDAAGPVTVFRKPITLELTYGTLRPAFIYYWDGEAWLQTPTTFAAGQHRAAAQTPHLTPFVGLATVAVPVAQGTPGIPTPLVVGGLLLVGGAIAASAVAVRRLSPAPEAPASPTKRSRQKPK